MYPPPHMPGVITVALDIHPDARADKQSGRLQKEIQGTRRIVLCTFEEEDTCHM